MKRKLIGTITERDFNWTVLINNGTVKWPLNPLMQWNRIYITQPTTPFLLFWKKNITLHLETMHELYPHFYFNDDCEHFTFYLYTALAIRCTYSIQLIPIGYYYDSSTIHAEILNVRYSTLEIKLCGLFYKPFPSYTIEHLFMEMQYTFISSFKSAYLAC